MILCATEYNALQEQAYICMAEQNRIDGIIGLTYDPCLPIPENIPFVTIDRYFNATIPCISSDNFGGGQLAAEKLVSLGCKHLAFLRIGSPLYNEPNKRKDGFETYCIQHQISYELKLLNDGDSEELFFDFLSEHMHDGKLDFDGIFCVTDCIAYHTIQMLTRLQLRVPEDVQVIGFDGTRMFDSSNYVCSTIVQPIEALAKTCVDTVLATDRSSLPSQICLPVTYAYGGTTLEEEPS